MPKSPTTTRPRGALPIVEPPTRIGGGDGFGLHIVLVEPLIPQNSGNIARLSAATGAWLHLVEPLGFDLDSRKIKRAGLDYWPGVQLSVHASFAALVARLDRASTWFFTKGAERRYTDVPYPAESVLVFGKETTGLDPTIHAEYADRLVRIPATDRVRSINLANAVAVAAYEVVRQHGAL